MGDREGLSPDAAAAQAREAVATLRTHGTLDDAGHRAWRVLFDLLHSGIDAEVKAAAALAALDAGALPVLTAALQQATPASHQGNPTDADTSSLACYVIGALFQALGKTRSVTRFAASPEAAAACDAVAEALAGRVAATGAATGYTSAACFALRALCTNGARPNDAAAAATAARGAVEALAASLTPTEESTAYNATHVLRALLTEHSDWPVECFKSATAAFLQAGGLDASLAALDSYGNNDGLLEILLAAFQAVLLVAPRQHVLHLSVADKCHGVLARALRRTSLPLEARESSASAAVLLAGDDATAHACLARAGVLDAAVACLGEYGKSYGGDADADSLVCACAEVIALAAQSGRVPSDMAAALAALAQAAPTPAARVREGCFTALRSLLELPGIVDVAVAAGLSETLAAAVRATCDNAPDASVCTDALRALFYYCIGCDEATHAVVRADGIEAAVRALRSHPRDTVVAHAACELLFLLSRVSGHDAAVAISAADGWIPLVAALRGHGAGDSLLAILACHLLKSGASVPDCRSAVAAAGAIPAIAGAMRAHISVSGLQICCVTALHCFAACGLQFADLLAAARAAWAVTAAMVQHASNAVLQRAGCLVLLCLCTVPGENRDSTAVRRAVAAAVASGAPAALVAALRTHASSVEDVRVRGSQALAVMLDAETWPSDGISWRETRDVLVAHIAAHGCFREGGVPDTLSLTVAALSLYNAPVPSFVGGPVPPGAAAVLCTALRTAIEVRCTAEDGSHLHVACRTMTISAGKACAYVAHLPGADSAAFRADACAAGMVELLITAAAEGARLDGGEPLGDSTSAASALYGLTMLSANAPAAQCRAAACGAHALADACKRAGAFADVCAEQRDAIKAMSRRLRALVTEHEDGECELPRCELQLMSRGRCCLPDCDAAPAEGARFKHCERCRCAAYCCRGHQVQAYPQHKAVCKARAAVDAARAALARQQTTEAMLDGLVDIGEMLAGGQR